VAVIAELEVSTNPSRSIVAQRRLRLLAENTVSALRPWQSCKTARPQRPPCSNSFHWRGAALRFTRAMLRHALCGLTVSTHRRRTVSAIPPLISLSLVHLVTIHEPYCVHGVKCMKRTFVMAAVGLLSALCVPVEKSR